METINFLPPLHVSFYPHRGSNAEDGRKTAEEFSGRIQRKDSARIQRLQNLEIHFVEWQTFSFTSSAEGPRKMCGRFLFTKGEWSIHLVEIELIRMSSYNSKRYYWGRYTDRLLLAKVSDHIGSI